MNLKVKKCIFLLLIILIISNINVFAEDSDSIKEEINSNNNKIEELEDEVDSIKEQIEIENDELLTIENEIVEKNNLLNDTKVKIEEYQSSIDSVQLEIDNINSEIIKIQGEVEDKNTRIEELKIEQIELQELSKNRIRSYYKEDVSKQFLYMIIKSENIFDIFNNFNKITKIMRVDRDLITKTEENEKELVKETNELNIKIVEMNEKQEVVNQRKNDLLLAQKEYLAIKEKEEEQIMELQYLQDDKEYLISALEDKEQSINDSIDSLLAYNYELQAKLDNIFQDINNSGSNNDIVDTLPESSGFLRPVNGVITSHFGPRINPVTGEAGYHNGIDYANDTGTPILASKSGVVVYSGWISGYGNTIILDHGSGVQTLYAHANSLTVNYGQAVNQGDEVAKVGSTGMSTGPHLHFEIRIDGVPMDPYIYIAY